MKATARRLPCVLIASAISLLATGQSYFEKHVPLEEFNSIGGAVEVENGNILVYYEAEIGETPFGGGSGDVFLMKMTDEGDILWVRQYDFGPDDGIYHRSLAYNGEHYAFCGFSLGDGTNSRDGFLCLTDVDGEIVNSIRLDEGGASNACHSINAVEDGWLLAGRTDGGAGDQYDMQLTKAGADGNILWAQSYGAGGWDWSYDAAPLPNGGFIVAGYGDGFAEQYNDAYVVATDNEGNKLWSRTLGTDSAEEFYDVAVDSEGNIYCAGHALGFIPNDFLPKGFICKISPNGDLLWTRIMQEVVDFNQLVVAQDGRIFAIGPTLELESGFGATDIMLAIISPDGDLDNAIIYGGEESDYPESIEIINDGFLISGGTFGFDDSGHKPFIIRTDESGHTGCTSMDYPASLLDIELSLDDPDDLLSSGFEQFDFSPAWIPWVAESFSACCAENVSAYFTYLQGDNGDFTFFNESEGDGNITFEVDGEELKFSEDSITLNLEDLSEFQACITIMGVCDTSVYCEDIVITNVTNLYNDAVFRLFPNPSKDQLSIHHPTPYHLSLHTSEGVLVRSSMINDDMTTIDTAGLKSGFYIVTLRTSDATLTRRIVLR